MLTIICIWTTVYMENYSNRFFAGLPEFVHGQYIPVRTDHIANLKGR